MGEAVVAIGTGVSVAAGAAVVAVGAGVEVGASVASSPPQATDTANSIAMATMGTNQGLIIHFAIARLPIDQISLVVPAKILPSI